MLQHDEDDDEIRRKSTSEKMTRRNSQHNPDKVERSTVFLHFQLRHSQIYHKTNNIFHICPCDTNSLAQRTILPDEKTKKKGFEVNITDLAESVLEAVRYAFHKIGPH